VTERSTLPPALDAEMDEVLSLLPLVDALPTLADRVFTRLADCLAEAVIHEIRSRHEHGELSRAGYLTEICQVVVELQARGLLDGRAIEP